MLEEALDRRQWSSGLRGRSGEAPAGAAAARFGGRRSWRRSARAVQGNGVADHVVAELLLEARHGELDGDASAAGAGGATREVLHSDIEVLHARGGQGLDDVLRGGEDLVERGGGEGRLPEEKGGGRRRAGRWPEESGAAAGGERVG